MMKKCLAFVLSLSVIGNSLFLGNVEAKVEKETLSNKLKVSFLKIKGDVFNFKSAISTDYVCILTINFVHCVNEKWKV